MVAFDIEDSHWRSARQLPQATNPTVQRVKPPMPRHPQFREVAVREYLCGPLEQALPILQSTRRRWLRARVHYHEGRKSFP